MSCNFKISNNTSGDTIPLNEHLILKTIVEKCNEEKSQNKLIVPLHDVERRVSFYTGLLEQRILELTKQNTLEVEPISLTKRLVIMKCLAEFYNTQKLPSLTEVYEEVSKHTTLPILPMFKKQMSILGFCYRKTNKGILLTEDLSITFERFRFFKKLETLRQSRRKFYYFDERVIDESLSFKKLTEDSCVNLESDFLVFLNLISEDGFENGIFLNHLNKEKFRKWILHVILPTLKPQSVIVLNNRYLYGSQVKITPYHSRENMIRWLRSKSVPYDNRMSKAELYDLIQRCCSPTNYTDFDQSCRIYGHEVLHIPANLQDLSPITIFWEDCKMLLSNSLQACNTLFMRKDYVYSHIKSPKQETWANYFTLASDIEKEMFEVDKIIESALDEYQFQVDDES